ncbi:hypothetical protein K7432_007774 [Basidiobolus ranarum]|uniref:Uncharacterized protein n=1 Tax=Basidiobolus ranarum TaxID=34480 RepID=A0ABR2W023_9FUNG
MKSFISLTIALASIAFVAGQGNSQDNGQAVRECLTKCDQVGPSWATCAAECVGVPHPTNKDVQETKDCFSQCGKNDGNCQNNCIKTHFIDSNASASAGATPNGTGTAATPTGTNGSTTNVSGQTASGMSTGTSNVATSTGVNQSPSVTPKSGSTKNGSSIMMMGVLISGLMSILSN